MARLILLRHAKSGYPDGVVDHDRPLSSRGEREAPLAGAQIQAFSPPTLVLVSTARRTQQTWQLVSAQLDPQPESRDEARIYEATVSGLLGVLSEIDDAQSDVMIVGHNPGLEDLAHFLVGAGDAAALSALNEKFPTSAIAVIAVDAPWHSLSKGCGTLTSFSIPRP